MIIKILILVFKLDIIALALFFFRKDTELFKRDLRVFVYKPFPYWFLSLIVVFFTLPISIMYSIAHLIKWKK